MKLIFWSLLILAMTFSHTAFSQTGAGQIRGKIRDLQNKALGGTTVSLQGESDSSIKRVRIAGADGTFIVSNLPEGSYSLTCTHIGFQNYNLNHLVIDAPRQAVILPFIILRPAGSQALKEVVVTVRKPLIEQKTDRTVINVDAMISAAGGSALEVLAKSPGVHVDPNGGIELNGLGGVLVLIDDKPTYLSVQDLAAYLRSLPAAVVDKIELMSNPPARYDASGSAVINLQLKKNRNAGFNGNLSLGYIQGFYARSNDALNVNYRAKKVNVFANISFSRDANYTNDNGKRYFYDSSGALNSTIQLQSRYSYSADGWNVRAGMDYFLSTKTTIGFVLTGNIRPKTDLSSYSSGQYNSAKQLDSISEGYTQGNYKWKSGGANVNFLHKFDAQGRQLSADLDYIRYTSDGSQLSPSSFYSAGGVLTGSSEILNQTPSVISIYAGKADYTQPLKGNAQLGAGLKSSLVKTDNENSWFDQAGGVFIPNLTNSNHFIYKENINAAYLSVKKEWRYWGVQGGVRMENTRATGDQVGNGMVVDSSFSKSYTYVFPSLFLSHKLDSSGDNTLVLSYSIRTRRPNYQQLDPFLFYQNQYTYTAGNPYLNPHYNHILQLKYAYRQYFGCSIAYFYVNNIIYSITQNINNVFITRPENFGINQSINFNAYANVSPIKAWDLNANVLVYNLTNKGNAFGQDIDDNHTTGEVELSNQFRVNRGWSAELSFFYHGPGNGGQTTSNSLWTASAGIQKKLWKDNGTIRLKMDDIFHSLRNHTTVITSGASYIHTSKSDTQLIGLALSYHFGKDANARRRNDNGSAEDEKGRAN